MRKSDGPSKPALFARSENIAESINLMHPLTQDCPDPDVAVCEMPPVKEMELIPEKDPLSLAARSC